MPIIRRRIDNLTELARLNQDQIAVLQRADGIIASLPKDGFVDGGELADRRFKDMLLPREAQWVAGLASFLGAGRPAPAAPAIEALARGVRVETSAPPALSRTDSVPIVALSPELRTLAERVQLKLNQDAQADTIAPVDVSRFLHSPHVAGLLPEERDLLPRLEDEVFALDNAAHPYAPGGRVEVPPLGGARTELTDVAALGKLALAWSTRLIEERRPGKVALTLERRFTVEVSLPPGATGLLLNSATGEEVRIPAGAQSIPVLAPGAWVLETWQDGLRLDAAELTFPKLPGAVEKVDLSAHAVGYAFFSGGAPLQRSFDGATTDGGRVSEARWSYGTAAGTPDPAGVDLSALTRPRPALPPGVYRGHVEARGGFTWNGQLIRHTVSYELEITPDGRVTLSAGDLKAELPHRGGQRWAKDIPRNNCVNECALGLDGDKVSVRITQATGSTRVRPSQRQR